MSSIALPRNVSFLDANFVVIGCALVTHAIYKRYEPTPGQIIVTFFLLGFIPLFSVHFMASHFTSLKTATAVSFVVFYSTLVSSIILYRISPLHPLYKYPGPFSAKVTKLWNIWIMAGGKNHVWYKKLHDKYGPYVRIGPNELSVTDVTAMPSILGMNGMPKGPMWEVRAGQQNGRFRSMISMRSFHEHAGRRKRWNRAFSTNSVKEYEPMVIRRALQLVDELHRKSSKGDTDSEISVDLAQWLSFFATDFMGDMAFGGGFELMRDGEDKVGIWTMLEEASEVVSYVQHIPWILPIGMLVPGLRSKLARLESFAKEMVIERKKRGSTTKDLFHHLIDEDHLEETPPAMAEVASDGVLAIVAGSDTTSTVLSGLFHFIISDSRCYGRLQAEVDSFFSCGKIDPFDTTLLAEMPYLNAVINEALRLQPPVPSTLQRAPEKGSGGHWIGSRFINEGTAIVVPPYALARDPKYFSPNPDTFWPERWLYSSDSNNSKDNSSSSLVDDKVEVVTNTAAFIPFSYGPANCAGRNLALVEMRIVVALLMQRFEMRFSQEYVPSRWEEDTEDFYVLKTGKLPVVLTSRV